MSVRIMHVVLTFLAVFAIISTVSADLEKLQNIARRKGFNEKIRKNVPAEAAPKVINRAPAAATTPAPTATGTCTNSPPPDPTNPPKCGGNNCVNAFNKQFTASLENLEDFCSSWTADSSSEFKPTGTAAWAKNCIGPSTAASLQSSVASKVSSACSCYVPEPTTCPGERFLNEKSKKYKVDSLPLVDFDVGEMYSGLIPIDMDDPSRALFFVFQPTVGAPVDEITIWFNGGPGCSSLEGFFQENGLFIWSWGMYEPQINPYSWVNLTNMLWVEQPVSTGFSIGEVRAKNEEDIAIDFADFFLNFQNIFGIKKFKIYVTGESYAGRYVPYVSVEMLNRNDTKHFDVQGALMYDPVIGSYNYIQEQLVAYPYIEENANMIHLNKSYMATLKGYDEECGFREYRDKYLVYPPSGVQPPIPEDWDDKCNINDNAGYAAFGPNPCFNSYEINTQCPIPSDPLGYPTNLAYSYKGLTPLYFDREDVKIAMHAPLNISWSECSGDPFPDGDASLDPIQAVLPTLIEATNRVLVSNAQFDMVIITAGTLLAIQNMTWGGALGFQTEPSTDIVITLPDLQYAQAFIDNGAEGLEDPQGTMGVSHFERGLMWAETFLAGHMQPQFQPRVSYRHLQWVLGRIEEL